MGICTRCGYITDDGDMAQGIPAEVHDCTPEHVMVGKKSWQLAQDAAVAEGTVSIAEDGAMKAVEVDNTGIGKKLA